MSSPATLWGEATYEPIAQRFHRVHEELVARLASEAGERWLDVATGLGSVALLAAERGAAVSASDFAPGMIERARAADPEGRVRWAVADAQALPDPDDAFDVVSSCFGAIFAPDPVRAAAELGRVCRPGGRLGLTAWVADPSFEALFAEFVPPGTQAPADPWADEEKIEALLGPYFDLELERRPFAWQGRDGEELWDVLSRGAGPMRGLLATLDAEAASRLHRNFVELYEQHRDGDEIRYERTYVLGLGRRR